MYDLVSTADKILAQRWWIVPARRYSVVERKSSSLVEVDSSGCSSHVLLARRLHYTRGMHRVASLATLEAKGAVCVSGDGTGVLWVTLVEIEHCIQ
jgi:hypothetical protein